MGFGIIVTLGYIHRKQFGMSIPGRIMIWMVIQVRASQQRAWGGFAHVEERLGSQRYGKSAIL